MSPEEAREAILQRVEVTRADIVAAKAHLLTLGSGRLTIETTISEWAKIASPSAPTILQLDHDVPSDIAELVARALSARLAMCTAAWELVMGCAMFANGATRSDTPRWQFAQQGRSPGHTVEWAELTMPFPEYVRRPFWMQEPSKLFDADLYLQRLAPASLHPNVEKALRISLECFQKDLFVPCVAMLGAASEGAWIELGRALAKRSRGESSADKLAESLKDSKVSTRTKISGVCHYYDRPECGELYVASGVKNTRLRDVQHWSDQIREARNVLHWEATPSVPNTYEKAAVLMMDAVSELTTLHAVRDEC